MASITFDGQAVLHNIDRMDAQMDRAIGALVTYYAQQGVAWAKQNARWTDRTGAARNGLFGRVVKTGRGNYEMTFGHGVPYGIWLEVRYSGRYAIIDPTVQHIGPELMRGARGLLGRMGR